MRTPESLLTQSATGSPSYKWDAENRLVEIDYSSGAKTQFTYDGLGRRIIDVETTSGGTTTYRYLWCDDGHLCQTRDGSDNVLRRDMAEGELNVNTQQKLIYMPDQLGSVRDVLDGTTGSLVDAYDFAPYGSNDRSYGTTSPTDYRFAGLLLHTASGLNLGTYRALDGVTGRFINRDPLGFKGGIKLYVYTGSNPINRFDPLGLCPPQVPTDKNGVPCDAKILDAVNAEFGTNFTTANINYNLSGMYNGAYNIIVTASPDQLTPGEFNALEPGRYSLSPSLGYTLGLGDSLHIPSGGEPIPINGVPTPTGFSNGNYGGNLTTTFTAHLDDGFPYNPIGFIYHNIVDIGDPPSRSPCP